MNRKILLILFPVAILFVVVLMISGNHQAKKETFPPQQEKGSATTTVALNGTDRLSQLLLPEQFAAIKKSLTGYIRSNVGSDVLSADIVDNSTLLNNDGSISFSVKTSSPSKQFSVLIQRPTALEMIFSVPGTNTEPTTLYPFNPQ